MGAGTRTPDYQKAEDRWIILTPWQIYIVNHLHFKVILEDGKALEGDWKDGKLDGPVRQVKGPVRNTKSHKPGRSKWWECLGSWVQKWGALGWDEVFQEKQAFNNHNAGTYRHLRGDGQLLGYGRCKGDERHGPCLRVRPQSPGVMNFVEWIHVVLTAPFLHVGWQWGQFLLLPRHRPAWARGKWTKEGGEGFQTGEKGMTESRSQGKEEGAYLYPNLAKAIVGSWKTKRSEHYSTAEYR